MRRATIGQILAMTTVSLEAVSYTHLLGSLGIVKGRKATCYPGFEKFLDGASYTAELVTVDDNITTGKGPAASFMYGFCILEQLTSKAVAEDVKAGMLINELIALR